MTSSNGNIFRVTGPLCGEFTSPGEFSAQRPVTRSFDVFFHLRLNKRLSKQPWGWWFETPAWSLWRHRNDNQFHVPIFVANLCHMKDECHLRLLLGQLYQHHKIRFLSQYNSFHNRFSADEIYCTWFTDALLWLGEVTGHNFNCATCWRHQMETFSALLAISAGNSPVNSPRKGQWRGVLMF